MEERPDAQKQILVEIAKKLPIFSRAQSGGKLSYLVIHMFTQYDSTWNNALILAISENQRRNKGGASAMMRYLAHDL